MKPDRAASACDDLDLRPCAVQVQTNDFKLSLSDGFLVKEFVFSFTPTRCNGRGSLSIPGQLYYDIGQVICIDFMIRSVL